MTTKLITSLFILTIMTTMGQTGKYIGLMNTGWTTDPPRKRNKHQTINPTYSQKTLILKNDSTFSFNYEYNVFSTRGIEVQKCEGTWKRQGDTLILNSKYKMTDFFSVVESFKQTPIKDLVTIILSGGTGQKSYERAREGRMEINSKSIGEYMDGDTIYTKYKSVESISVDFHWPGYFVLKYSPHEIKSNYFLFNITTEINGNNLYFENHKFLLKDDELISLSQYSPLHVDKNYKKNDAK